VFGCCCVVFMTCVLFVWLLLASRYILYLGVPLINYFRCSKKNIAGLCVIAGLLCLSADLLAFNCIYCWSYLCSKISMKMMKRTAT
jgi:hypothetical protein